jgi:thymidylate synthase
MEITRNTADSAFRTMVHYFIKPNVNDLIRMPSRNGEVIMIPQPVNICYANPRHRVLFNRARDCNPFFHLYEALWMLAGRNNVAPLNHYSSNIKNYSDDGETFNGAYGYRWRHHFVERKYGEIKPYRERRVDQLKILINHIKQDPYTRRAVLQMWNVQDDLLKIDGDNYSKDVCCNTNIYFQVEPDVCKVCDGGDKPVFGNQTVGNKLAPSYSNDPCPSCEGTGLRPTFLNMTVCNRSNDMVWGTFGANLVHMSILQEYVAAHLGLHLGSYYQFTNNLHVYTERWNPEQLLNDDTPDYYYQKTMPTLVPLVKDPKQFDLEVVEFVEHHSKDAFQVNKYQEPFLSRVAQPMCMAFHLHKKREYKAALDNCSKIVAEDWRIAATNWITKRRDNYAKRRSL